MAIDAQWIVARRAEFARRLSRKAFQSIQFIFAEFVFVFVAATVAVRAVVPQEMDVT